MSPATLARSLNTYYVLQTLDVVRVEGERVAEVLFRLLVLVFVLVYEALL